MPFTIHTYREHSEHTVTAKLTWDGVTYSRCCSYDQAKPEVDSHKAAALKIAQTFKLCGRWTGVQVPYSLADVDNEYCWELVPSQCYVFDSDKPEPG